MNATRMIFRVLLALVSAALVLNGAGCTAVKANDGGLTGQRYFTMPPRVTESDYKPNTVVLKMKEDLRVYCGKDHISLIALERVLNAVGATGVERMFPHAEQPLREKNKYGMKYADLTLIYEFKYTGDSPVEEVVNRIYALGLAEYVQPYYIHHEFYTPNDPQIGSQYHLSSVKAYQAWNTQKGNSNITVAIIDSGTDTAHPDLSPQFKYNSADPIDGIDNDADGYVDNNLGWDFVGNDNNTQWAGDNHGVHVAGCAVAATDNNTGVASPGFGCSYLPVKAGDGGTIDYGYTGITYAADHGASVINCSWGGAGGGQLGQDVIDYATLNKDALVVAAAGNDAVEDLFYPASFNYVLNVASTASNDTKSGFSNYGYAIDVCAPGSSIFSTLPGNTYGYRSGTSMASPVAAGCAALVRAEYPFLDAVQAGEQLKVTCDNIYPVNQSAYQDKLGAGRINLYSAVSGINKPSIVMTERNVSDGGDEAFVVGDTLNIDGIFTNFLAPTGAVTATLTALSANVQVLDGTTSLGALAAFGGTADNSADPFTVKILPGAALNERVVFKLTLTDGSYTTKIFFQIIVNVDYINITINDVATSITSKSLIGFNDFSTQLEGLGFIYPYSILGTGSNILFDCGLMVGTTGNVSDNVRTTGGGTDQDFVSASNVQRLPVPLFSEFDVEGEFNDSNSVSPMAIGVSHKAFAWSETGHRKYVIVEYTITNNSGNTLNALYAGLFADWDINDYAQNKGGTVESRRLGYIYDTQAGGVWAGMQVVSTSGDFIHNAMFNNQTDDPGGSGIYPNTNYATADKYASLSTMNLSSGGTGVGKDVSNVVSTGPFDLASGSSVTVAFAIMAGDDLADITATADSAYTKYNPCSNLTTTITSTDEACGGDGAASVSVNIGTGPYSYLWSGGETTSSVSALVAGTYQVTVTTANGCTGTATTTIGGTVPLVATTSSSSAACGATDGAATVSVTSGTPPYTYLWDISAGSQTTATAIGLGAGEYEVSVTDGAGCETTFSLNVSNTGAGTASIALDQDITCYGGSDGQATSSITGGLPPYTYLWDNGDSTATASGLNAGSHTVLITDSLGCIVFEAITLNEPPATTADTSSTGDDGTANGTATVTVTGGTGPFSYAWSTLPIQTTATASGLTTGNYTVTITDSAGCETGFSITVTGPTVTIQREAPIVTGIYPNPNEGLVSVVFGDYARRGAVVLSLRNLLGQEVMARRITVSGQDHIRLDLHTLDKGAYFLTVTDDKAEESFKILVQ